MRRSSAEWDKVGMLLERHAHLNQLRVGTVQVYLVVVAAVLALWGGTEAIAEPSSFAAPLGFCLIGVGILVYIYDLRLRARTYAVAVEVARSSPDNEPGTGIMKPKLFDEDLAFSMVLMLVNSTLVFIGIEYWLSSAEPGALLSLTVAAVFLALQIAFYCWHWPRLASRMSAWPDRVARTETTSDEEPERESTDGS